jgi:hypothetical protein
MYLTVQYDFHTKQQLILLRRTTYKYVASDTLQIQVPGKKSRQAALRGEI